MTHTHVWIITVFKKRKKDWGGSRGKKEGKGREKERKKEGGRVGKKERTLS